MKIVIDIPDQVTLGDLQAAQGAIFNASTMYVDWEELASGSPDAVAKPGVILLAIAAALGKESNVLEER